MLLPQPFPGTRPPRRATAPPHTPMEAHTAAWSIEGLADFLRFVRVFVAQGVLGGGEETPAERLKNPAHTAGWSIEGLGPLQNDSRTRPGDRGTPPCWDGTPTMHAGTPLGSFSLLLKLTSTHRPPLSLVQDYSDATMLGWYAHHACWHAPENAEASPACAAEPCCGITPERAARLAGRFTPR
ncbi:unnamed protein product [Closterium sp. NIES-65]|nr:unnamed protein product [Closterium sp. NIES-65]